MLSLFAKIKTALQGASSPVRVVFPEGEHPLIQKVAQQLTTFNVTPVLVFATWAAQQAVDVPAGVETVVIADSDGDRLARQLFNLRRGKVTLPAARTLVQQPVYFATMLLKNHTVDALVGGISYPTSAIIRPALQIIRARPHTKLVSSVFLMVKGAQQLLFTDCALNVAPTASQLATIARLGYKAARLLDLPHPQLALLSYSTHASGQGETVDRVRAAVNQLRTDHWQECHFDGPLQVDAALNAAVRAHKAPHSSLTTNANILVFPDLNAANIGYKLTQRLGGFQAVGPLLIGLNQPVNDLSRGATASDVLQTALFTAYEGLMNRHVTAS